MSVFETIDPRYQDWKYNPDTDTPFFLNPKIYGHSGKTMTEQELFRIRRESYRGCVLQMGEHNGYDDSDFYAIVWDDEHDTVLKIMYGTTRGYSDGTAHIDAKPDSYAYKKAQLWLNKQWTEKLTKDWQQEQNNALVKDKVVRSTTTRGKNVGLVGVVRWVGTNEYRTYYSNGYNKRDSIENQRVGIRAVKVDSDGNPLFDPNGKLIFDPAYPKLVYLAGNKVEVLNAPQEMSEEEKSQRDYLVGYKVLAANFEAPFLPTWNRLTGS